MYVTRCLLRYGFKERTTDRPIIITTLLHLGKHELVCLRSDQRSTHIEIMQFGSFPIAIIKHVGKLNIEFTTTKSLISGGPAPPRDKGKKIIFFCSFLFTHPTILFLVEYLSEEIPPSGRDRRR